MALATSKRQQHQQFKSNVTHLTRYQSKHTYSPSSLLWQLTTKTPGMSSRDIWFSSLPTCLLSLMQTMPAWFVIYLISKPLWPLSMSKHYTQSAQSSLDPSTPYEQFLLISQTQHYATNFSIASKAQLHSIIQHEISLLGSSKQHFLLLF